MSHHETGMKCVSNLELSGAAEFASNETECLELVSIKAS
jgi:hypothetical protein